MADNRKKEGRKERKEREGSGPEDKCLPTRSRPPFYQGSRSSRFNERKSGREKEREREREREREDRIAPRRHNWPRQDASARARRMRSGSARILARRSARGSSCRSGSGESGSGLGSKMLHERVHVRRCNWPPACRPVQPVRAYVRIRDRAIPPTLPRERASTLTCFLPYRFICNLKRGLDCPMPAPPPSPLLPHINRESINSCVFFPS